MRVRDDIRIESEEEHCEYAGDRTSGLFREAIEEESGEQSEENDRESREENEEIGIVAHLIEEARADIPLLVDPLRPERIIDGECRTEEEERESDEIFEERRMLVIDAHIAIADRAVGGGDMRPLVIGRRIGPGAAKRESEEDDEHERDGYRRVSLERSEEVMHKIMSKYKF